MAENTAATTTVYTPAIASGVGAATFTLPASTAVAPNDNARFSINSSGAVVFNTAPDFEDPGDENKDNIYEVRVTATVGTQTANQNVKIIVTNVLEAPVFTAGLLATHPVAENTTVVGYNTTLLVAANTKDAVRFSLPTAATGYEDNDKLSINPNTGALNFITAPDFEAPAGGAANNSNDYKVRIAARAGGNTVNHDFTVRVTNLLEQPVINSAESASVPENTGTAYTATVADAAQKDAVQFSLAPGLLENDQFNIDATTGAVTFSTAPNFENPGDSDKNNVYVIELTATAGGTSSATKLVSIRVTDVNEVPAFTSGTAVSVKERTPGVIYTATATDPDAGNNITFALTAGAADFNLSGDKVSFITPPTFNSTTASENIKTFTLTATDDASPALSATQTVTVTITDEPDETPPVFVSGNGTADARGHKATATVSVKERTPASTIIYIGTATDDREGEITYELTTGDATFSREGGSVRFKTSPTFNSTTASANTKTFTLTARDQANNTATQTVTVTITDETDDTAPTFTSAATASVEENTGTSKVVYTATANEPATFSAATATGTSGANDNDLFNVYPSGAVTFKAMPNFENPTGMNKNNTDATKNDYVLHLHATDTANNKTATHLTLTITVTDVDPEPAYTDPYTGMAFEKVEHGNFTRGSNTITLTSGYYIGKYEVTQAEWKRVMGNNPSSNKATGGTRDNYPVEQVSYTDITEANGFLAKLNAELKKTDPDTKWVYRLPTEAEWEYAARGGHNATATTYAGSNTVGNVAWYSSNSSNTRPVRQKAANELGLYDMSGNVWEWCSDWYGGTYPSTAQDPTGPATSSLSPGRRVTRGGGYNADEQSTKVDERSYLGGVPGQRLGYIGFRLCLSEDNTAPDITSAAAVSVYEYTLGSFYTATATDYISTLTRTTLRFSLTGGQDKALFSINATSGELSFKTPTDFENPADANKDNVYVVQFSVADAVGNTAHQTIRVIVTDRPEDYTDPYTSMVFKIVQKGTFTMGCTSEQSNCNSNESPTHSVTLTKDYYMGQYEVTQAEWVKVMGSNPSYFSGCDNCPVEKVSWNDVQNFITKLNTELLKNNHAELRRYRLPTEAEWEYAARGGYAATATSGKGATQYSGGNSIGTVAWYSSNSSRKTHPVGGKSANELGLYDMSGNVWEWCSDRYGSYSSGAKTDPVGPSSGWRRVGRGGSWYHNARGCGVSIRYFNNPISSYSDGGFRLCFSLSGGMP